jgi:hypothetical protein
MRGPPQETLRIGLELPSSAPFPPICPDCGRSGVRAVPLTAPGNAGGITLYYCELCHGAMRTRATRYFALSMTASILLSTAIGASIALRREQFLGALPLWGAITFGLLVLSFTLYRRVQRGKPELEVDADGRLVVWLPPSPGVDALQSALGILSRRRTSPGTRVSRGASLLLTAPLAAALLPIGVSQAWLQARVIVLDPELDGLFLVDQRWVAEAPVVRAETARGGYSLRLLAGERTLTLVGKDGVTRLETTAWLAPGKDYVFGRLPDGLCLFRQTEFYGAVPEHRLEELRGGPLFEIAAGVQYWFEEAPSAEAASTRGGTATALRLLPCGSGGKAGHF